MTLVDLVRAECESLVSIADSYERAAPEDAKAIERWRTLAAIRVVTIALLFDVPGNALADIAEQVKP